MNIYHWKRFWQPINNNAATIAVDYDGFLCEPSKYTNGQLKTLEELQHKDYLILIGEPGIGKTSVLKQFEDSIEEAERHKYLFENLVGIADRYSMDKKIFDRINDKLQKSEENILVIFLDGLDECQLEFRSAAVNFVNGLSSLRKYKSRLKIRITCRTKDLPSALKEGLKDFYSQTDKIPKSSAATESLDEIIENIFELAPLTKQNVDNAASQNNFEPTIFLNEISNKDVVPLAVKPITLNFLLTTYKNEGGFPNNISELYIEGLKTLASEQNRIFIDFKETGNLSKEGKLVIAARIAIFSKFCNLNRISKLETDSNSLQILTYGDLIGDYEMIENIEIPVTKQIINETLSTSLFIESSKITQNSP